MPATSSAAPIAAPSTHTRGGVSPKSSTPQSTATSGLTRVSPGVRVANPYPDVHMAEGGPGTPPGGGERTGARRSGSRRGDTETWLQTTPIVTANR